MVTENMVSNIKLFLTTIGLAMLISLNSSSSLAYGNDGPLSDHDDGPSDEWAPNHILRFNFVSGNLILLSKKYETNIEAFYKVPPSLPEPDKSFCTTFPNSCKIVRTDDQ
jgi:hypothetical protein